MTSADQERSSPRPQVAAVLSQLIGLPLTAARRAADMRTLQFGTLRPVEGGSVGSFALHIQCSWRVEGPEGIVTGRSDLWEPLNPGPDFDWDTWGYAKTPNLQDARVDKLMAEMGALLVVRAVDADDHGGATIQFDEGYALQLFPEGSRGEDWRLFRPDANEPHFVISGGQIERPD